MNEIKCPNCGEVFQIDEKNYESILKQVKDKEFQSELEKRIEDALTLEKNKTEAFYKEEINKLDLKVLELKSKLENKEVEAKLQEEQAIQDVNKKLLEKENEINRLNGLLENGQTKAKLDLSIALSKKQEEITQIKADKEILEESYKEQLKSKDELIAYYKDFKAKQSTKMIGEDLEQHCLYEFNRVRPLFSNAYFEKDNDASMGSKGDFIFKDYDDEKNEIISIMFEMKNEADETSTKHKNEDFLAKLDKDRKNKNCEYAVLVSLLEMDNETYNEGIVDMSHRYPKMYVIRPQNFITIISLLRNAALNSLAYKKELQVAKSQDLDYEHFEENMNAFKEAFGKNYDIATRKFETAIDEIDKSIDHLQKIRDALTSSSNQLRLANDKAQDLSIKKLTKNAPSVYEKLKK